MGISGEHFSIQLTPDRHDPINLTRSYPVQRRLLLRIPKVGLSYRNGGGRGMGDVRRRRPQTADRHMASMACKRSAFFTLGKRLPLLLLNSRYNLDEGFPWGKWSQIWSWMELRTGRTGRNWKGPADVGQGPEKVVGRTDYRFVHRLFLLPVISIVTVHKQDQVPEVGMYAVRCAPNFRVVYTYCRSGPAKAMM